MIKTYAVDCNDAWLNTKGDDISGSYVKYKDHQTAVAELEAKCAALAAKGMELVAEAAAVYGKYNETQMPDLDLVDMQTIQEMHDLCAGVENADAFLADQWAQGVDMLRDSIAEVESSIENTIDLHHFCSDFAAQLRQGVPECFNRLLKHAYGMSMGKDRNKGTGAGHHREGLCKAVEDCRAAFPEENNVEK